MQKIWFKRFYPIISSCRASGFIFIFSYAPEYIRLFLINIHKIIQSSFLSDFNEITKNIKIKSQNKITILISLKLIFSLKQTESIAALICSTRGRWNLDKQNKQNGGFNLLNTWPLEPRQTK